MKYVFHEVNCCEIERQRFCGINNSGADAVTTAYTAIMEFGKSFPLHTVVEWLLTTARETLPNIGMFFAVNVLLEKRMS